MGKKTKRKTTPTISEQLRTAIVDSGLSLQHVARESGVNVAALSRFVRSERSMTLESADRLAEYLSLDLQSRD